MNPRRVSPFLLIALIIGGLAFPSFGSTKTAPAPSGETGAVLQLSPFEVKAQSVEFNQWKKVSSPHFILYTDASIKESTLLVRQMEMLHQAAQFYLRRKSLNLAPLIVVLPTSRSDWRKIESRGAVEWEVATTMHRGTRDLLLVQHDWQADGLGTIWASIGQEEVAGLNLHGPLWFVRGLGAFFSTASFENDTLTIGRQGSAGYSIQKYGWLDWPRFFNVNRTSPEFVKDSHDHDRFESQCSLFVHYLLTNGDPVWTSRLIGWAAYLHAGNEPTEEAFAQVFQEKSKTFESRLDELLHGGSYKTGIIRFPPAALQFPVTTGTAPAAEMRELFVLAQIMNQRGKDGDAALDSLLQKDLKTETLRDLLADACDDRDRDDPELLQLRAIVAAGSTNPRVFSELAHELFRRVIKKPSLDARLTDQADEIRTLCKQALQIEPLYVEANETLAWTEALAPSVDKTSLETIARICRNLDGNSPTDESLVALAVARWRNNNPKQARTLCDRLVASPLSRKESKALAKELLARLDAAAPSAASTVQPKPVDAAAAAVTPQ